MKLYIHPQLLTQAKAALEFVGVTNQIRGIKIIEPSEVIDECEALLTSNSGFYMSHDNVQIVIDRLKQLVTENEVLYDSWYPENEVIKAKIDLMEVFSGFYSYLLLKEKLFSINYTEMGFPTFIDFISCTGAYISQSCNKNYHEAEYYWETDHANGTRMLNRFHSCTHGDFRFIQYDVTPRASLSPYGDTTSIFKAEHKMLFAYHSLEAVFFATILRYSIQRNFKIPVMFEYENFLNTIAADGERLGFFGDAGDNHHFFVEPSLLESPIPDLKDADARNWHTMAKEAGGHCRASIDESNLVYFPDDVRFTTADLNHLVIGLHKACQEGMGRTSLGNLVSFVELVLEPYKNAFAESCENVT